MTKKEGKVINSVKNINKDEVLTISFHDGEINTKVI